MFAYYCVHSCTFMRRACPLLGAEITPLLLVNYNDYPEKETNTNVLGARDRLANGCEYSWSVVHASQKKAPARAASLKPESRVCFTASGCSGVLCRPVQAGRSRTARRRRVPGQAPQVVLNTILVGPGDQPVTGRCITRVGICRQANVCTFR